MQVRKIRRGQSRLPRKEICLTNDEWIHLLVALNYYAEALDGFNKEKAEKIREFQRQLNITIAWDDRIVIDPPAGFSVGVKGGA